MLTETYLQGLIDNHELVELFGKMRENASQFPDYQTFEETFMYDYTTYRGVEKMNFRQSLKAFVSKCFASSRPQTKEQADDMANNIFNIGNIETAHFNTNAQQQEANKNAIKILFMSANPQDQRRITSEFDDMREKVKDSIQRGELEFCLPTWDADYDKLMTRLKNDKPHVLHYSGHSTQAGMCLVNNADRTTQMIENHELKDIFENRTAYLKLVFLNSCFSSAQAEVISQQGIYVLGIENAEIANELAINLAERFYLGFTAQEPPISIEKAIRIGCTNFAKTYPAKASTISLWKNGVKTDYKTIA